MALAMHEGKIHLTLRNPEDADTLKIASIDTREILGNGPTPQNTGGRRAAAKPTVVYRDREVPAAPAPEQPYKVTVIKRTGTTTTETAEDKNKGK
jgi:hypothetical protein